jgi:hypothetical protein
VPVLALREGFSNNLVDQAVSEPLPEGWSEYNVVELVLQRDFEKGLEICKILRWRKCRDEYKASNIAKVDVGSNRVGRAVATGIASVSRGLQSAVSTARATGTEPALSTRVAVNESEQVK